MSRAESFENAAREARRAASAAREAASVFEELAEQLTSGDVVRASETYETAAARFAVAQEAAAACDDWLVKSSERD